jgi:hypothetical protein
MNDIIDSFQNKMKSGTSGLFSMLIRLALGGFLGLTFAILTDSVADLGRWSFVFLVVTITAVVMRLTRTWRVSATLIFLLFVILMGTLLRMYVLWAPGE